MEKKIFKEILKNNNAIKLNEDYLLFNDLELYNLKTEKSINFGKIEEMYQYVLNDKTIEEIIDETNEFIIHYDGGRGSGSSNSKMGGGFTSAGGRRVEGGKKEFPARLNTETGGRFKSYEKTLSKFEKMYKNSEIEYGASIDEQGYSYKLIKGGKTSVPISGTKGQMIVHNHPSGGNFSKQDLVSIASGKEKGIVAVGSNTKNRMRYSLTKNKNFKPKEFIKAVNKAKWPSNLSYDKGADWWLRRNAKTYGYKYSAKKIK